MKEIKINIDDSVIASVQEVIEPLDFDIEMVMKILLKRISREKNLDFLLVNGKTQEENKPDNEDPFVDKKSTGGSVERNTIRDMRKSLAISIFRSKGIVFSDNITYASKNRTAYNYWANPTFERLELDWFLILNDWINRVIYLFKVPSGAISQGDLTSRADNNNQIDLQILYNDPNFRDTRSNQIFKKFLVMSENY
jgi:antitoxin component of RelBE/YafQ-DinJ toxin-antitoxin module